MATTESSPFIRTGCDTLDQDHEIFMSLLDKLGESDNADFPAVFNELYAHVEQHFERENLLMADSAYPAAGEHRGEHGRVLAEFKQFKTRVDKGLIAFGRAFVKERLPAWFVLHASTMDSALAAHLRQRERD